MGRLTAAHGAQSSGRKAKQMDNETKQKPRKIIDLDAILAKQPEAGGQWDLDELVQWKSNAPTWERLFTPAAVAAIRAAAGRIGCSPEVYIQIATLRQLDSDIR